MSASDLQTKSRVRSILSRHWIDLGRIDFGCCKGTIRFRGELRLVEKRRAAVPLASLIETLEMEIKSIQTVKNVYFMGVTVDGDYELSLIHI